jgi:phosphoribosylformylglycinamidine synthase
MHAVVEAARNVAASGARPIAATNCLNFGSPEKPEVMWQFSEVIDGIAEACNALGTPITGGNVSFYNETLGKSIYPTPVIGVLGILDDPSRVLKIAFRNEGDVIVLLDGSSFVAGASAAADCAHPAPLVANQPSVRHSERSEESLFAREFSSSEYSKTIGGIVAGEPPAIDLVAEKRLIDCLVVLASHGAIESAHDISDGGLTVTLAESCLASATASGSSSVGAGLAPPDLGAIVHLADDLSPAESVLFGERGARAVVSVSLTNLAAVPAIARQYNVAAREIGRVTRDDAFRIEHKGRVVIESTVEMLHDAWAHSLERTLVKR